MSAILPHERKFVMMVNLMDKIVKDDLEITIDKMLKRDPRLLCRLNLENSKVKKILAKKIAEGLLHPFDLLYDPEETFQLMGISKTQYEQINNPKLTPEDAKWLEELTDKFKKTTKAQAMERRSRKLDESTDDCLALR